MGLEKTFFDAQMNKINHILKKLNLKDGLSLLDIGCGWGGLLIEAAKQYKVKGLGITLSEEQYIKFKERIKEEHLEEYLEVRLMDYRDLKKSKMKFDRIVSVGMLEHVGRSNYDLFFENVDAVLKESGLFHSIIYNLDGSIRDGRLGMKLSDGCIRLAKVNAKWIYDNVPAGSTVYIE